MAEASTYKSTMAKGTADASTVRGNTDHPSPQVVLGRPSSPLEVQDPPDTAVTADDENVVYPKGRNLWLTVLSIMLASVMFGLDLTIVAVAVPSITDHFKTIKDIGWYSAVYGLVGSSVTFFWAKCYSVFSVKKCYLTSMIIFELGALVATVAPTSTVFILGRALSGCGGTGMKSGLFVLLTHMFPNPSRPMWGGITGFAQTATMVTAPLIGGALINKLSWRACFGINIPVGVFALVLVFFGFNSPIVNQDENLPLKQKLWKLDPLGTVVFIASITCLLMALQWGGTTYSWSDWRIVILLVLSSILIVIFGYMQHRLQDNATLPPRILKNRTVLAGSLFEFCCEGCLVVTEYYISIYFQGVRGYTAFKSGYLYMPLIVGVSVAALLAGFGITRIGYYVPFMLAASILGPIGSGLLTTINLETDLVSVLALLGLIGVAIGLGITVPTTALMNVLPIKDVPLGLGVDGFAVRLGSALLISTSATIFQDRLKNEISHNDPGQNATAFEDTGLSDLRRVIGQNRLKAVLLGYDKAVIQTLYLPVALMVVSLLPSLAMEWRSVKKKRE